MSQDIFKDDVTFLKFWTKIITGHSVYLFSTRSTLPAG